MRSEKDVRTLICYAGSASEASIGSKPVGSELDNDMGVVATKSQENVDSRNTLLAGGDDESDAQDIDIICCFESLRPLSVKTATL